MTKLSHVTAAIAASLFLAVLAIPAEAMSNKKTQVKVNIDQSVEFSARRRHTRRHRVAMASPTTDAMTPQERMDYYARGGQESYAPVTSRRSSSRTSYANANGGGATMLPHPAGCPSRAFCSCGAAVDVYGGNGSQYRSLWPSCAWFSGKFPRAAPAPGMVAGRCGHVYVLKRHVGGNDWLVADYNSGGHRSRLHVRNIGNAKVVNPHGSRAASLD